MQLKAAEELNRCLCFELYAATGRMLIIKQQIAACEASWNAACVENKQLIQKAATLSEVSIGNLYSTFTLYLQELQKC